MRQSRAFLYGLKGGGGLDIDAQNFINAANIIDNDQQSYVNTLVTDLKTANLWDKIRVIYPMVGGTAFNHKFNLKDPRDLDAAFRLDFTVGTGSVHSVNGWEAISGAQFADTHFSMSNEMNIDSVGTTITIGNEDPRGSIVIGALNSDGRFSFIASTGSIAVFRIGSQVLPSNATTKGVFTAQKISAAQGNVWKSEVKIQADTNISGTLPSNSLYLNAMNNNGNSSNADRKRIQSTFIHEGLNDSEVLSLHSIINQFENNLNRKTW